MAFEGASPAEQGPAPSPAEAEAARLAALQHYDVLDTPSEPAFDRIARLARDLFDTPVAMVSLIDETRQWFKARIGLTLHEVPRHAAICDHTILPARRNKVLVVEDLSGDPRFQANDLVLGGPRFRFYAGAPLVTPDGACVGTVSVLSPQRRPAGISDAQRRWLRSLAAMAVDELELRIQARLAREAAARAEAWARRAETAAAAEARLRRAQEAAGVVAFEFGPRGVSEAGGALRALYGLPSGVTLSFATVLAAVHPEDRGALVRDWARLSARGGAFEHEYRVVLPDGAIRWLLARGLVLESPQRGGGRPRLITGVVQDVTARRDAENVRTLLAREVDHRAKNALAVVQAALRLTPRGDPATFAANVEGRISALARAHALLAKEKWAAADLRDIVEGELESFLRQAGPAPGGAEIPEEPRIMIEGPPTALAPHAVQPMAMAVHELATNATKHGALGRPAGRLTVSWQVAEGMLAFRWEEHGGPPVPGPPAHRGFGSRLLETTIQRQLGGTLRRDWQAEGLACEILVPIQRVLAA